MKILVTYLSGTGNTKKIADAIYDEINCEKEIKLIDEVNNLEGYDLTFVGSPIHAHGPSGKFKKFLKNKCDTKKIAIFLTHATPEEYAKEIREATKEVAKNTKLLGIFSCQGQLAFWIKLIMRLMVGTKLSTYAKEDNSQGQPNKERVEKARVFAREIVEKVKE